MLSWPRRLRPAPWMESRLARRAQVGLLLLALVVVPPWLNNNYITTVLTGVCLYTMLGLGLNIVVGYAGLLDLGYAAFFAIGAYATAYLMTTHNVSFWLMLPLGALLAALFGVIVGAPTLRLRSDYLAIVTLGFGEITRIAVTNLDFTGGPSGLYGVPQPALGRFVVQTPLHYYYLIFVLVLVTLVCVSRLADSRIGRAWAYIREDELAAEAMGINTVRIKLLAYALGAVWAGVAGCFLAVQLSAISPEGFKFEQSVNILIIVVPGGVRRIPGVILGAVVVQVLPEVLRGFETWRLFLFALALIALMIFRPEGLWPSRQRKREMRSYDVALVGAPDAAAEAESVGSKQ